MVPVALGRVVLTPGAAASVGALGLAARIGHGRRHGAQVAIDTLDDVAYESLCAACYLAESGGVLNGERVGSGGFVAATAPDADFA